MTVLFFNRHSGFGTDQPLFKFSVQFFHSGGFGFSQVTAFGNILPEVVKFKGPAFIPLDQFPVTVTYNAVGHDVAHPVVREMPVEGHLFHFPAGKERTYIAAVNDSVRKSSTGNRT